MLHPRNLLFSRRVRQLSVIQQHHPAPPRCIPTRTRFWEGPTTCGQALSSMATRSEDWALVNSRSKRNSSNLVLSLPSRPALAKHQCNSSIPDIRACSLNRPVYRSNKGPADNSSLNSRVSAKLRRSRASRLALLRCLPCLNSSSSSSSSSNNSFRRNNRSRQASQPLLLNPRHRCRLASPLLPLRL